MTALRRNLDPQSDSKDLRQLDLLERGNGTAPVEVDIATVRRQASLQAAIGLCIATSGLDRKQIYGSLDIDAATFSRIESGQAHFPPNKLPMLMELCRNEAPLIWLAEGQGYDFSSMRKHRTTHERRVAELEEENRDLRRLLRLKAEAGL
jgi:hypothetical protein